MRPPPFLENSLTMARLVAVLVPSVVNLMMSISWMMVMVIVMLVDVVVFSVV